MVSGFLRFVARSRGNLKIPYIVKFFGAGGNVNDRRLLRRIKRSKDPHPPSELSTTSIIEEDTSPFLHQY